MVTIKFYSAKLHATATRGSNLENIIVKKASPKDDKNSILPYTKSKTIKVQQYMTQVFTYMYHDKQECREQ